MLCGDHSLVNTHARGKVAVSLVCRAWTCSACRPVRKRQLITLGRMGRPNRLLTLTVNPKVGVSPADRAARLARAWRLIVGRAKRQLKLPDIQYLAVFEKTKRGEPHLHILLRCGYLPQAWLSSQAKDILGAPIVDIRRIHNLEHAARYVAKYVGKAPHRFATAKRYWHTRCWVDGTSQPEEPQKWTTGRWEIVERTVFDIWKDWGGAWGLAHLDNGAAWTGCAEPPWARPAPTAPPRPAGSGSTSPAIARQEASQVW